MSETTSTETSKLSVRDPRQLDAVLAHVRQALVGLQFGEVSIVVQDGVVIGLITLSQVKQVDHSAWPIRRVADVMTPLAETLIVSPSSPMNEVVERMSENETRRVIVAQEWELKGIITGGDVANWLDRAGLVRS